MFKNSFIKKILLNNMNFFSNKYLKVLVAYGSQTGCAEAIAQILHKKLSTFIVGAELSIMNDIKDIKNLETYDYIVFLVSTTGDGDFPDNANKFWRKMRRYKEKDLKKVNYCILGLGDTNYNNFCFSSKSLNRRLKKNLAKEYLPIEFADDAVGLEDVVEPWLIKVEDFLRNKQKDIQNWFIKSMTG